MTFHEIAVALLVVTALIAVAGIAKAARMVARTPTKYIHEALAMTRAQAVPAESDSLETEPTP